MIKNTLSRKNFTSQELSPPLGSDPRITSANMAKNWAHETWRVIRKGKYHRWFSSTISHQLRHIFGFCCRFLVLKELISQLESYLGCWYVSMMRKWVIRHTNARRPSGLCASGEWDTRLPIYLNLSAESFPHRATAATFLSRLSCSPADRTRYTRTDTSESWGWILRSARRIGRYCWLKQLDLYKWTTRIIPRVESQISAMIWSSDGMRTENTQLKAISTLCTKDQRVSQRSFGFRAQFQI